MIPLVVSTETGGSNGTRRNCVRPSLAAACSACGDVKALGYGREPSGRSERAGAWRAVSEPPPLTGEAATSSTVCHSFRAGEHHTTSATAQTLHVTQAPGGSQAEAPPSPKGALQSQRPRSTAGWKLAAPGLGPPPPGTTTQAKPPPDPRVDSRSFAPEAFSTLVLCP